MPTSDNQTHVFAYTLKAADGGRLRSDTVFLTEAEAVELYDEIAFGSGAGITIGDVHTGWTYIDRASVLECFIGPMDVGHPSGSLAPVEGPSAYVNS